MQLGGLPCLHAGRLSNGTMLALPAQVITNNGRSVPPEEVSMRTQDPRATADYFQEGVHYVPDTEEFLEAIGHWATSDADLIGRRCALWREDTPLAARMQSDQCAC